VVFQESASSSFWLQLVWGLGTGGQQAVNFFHLVGVLISTQQFKGMVQNIIYFPGKGTKGP